MLATAAIKLKLKRLGYLVFIGLLLPATYFTFSAIVLVYEYILFSQTSYTTLSSTVTIGGIDLALLDYLPKAFTFDTALIMWWTLRDHWRAPPK